jgi:hypothetical protein
MHAIASIRRLVALALVLGVAAAACSDGAGRSAAGGERSPRPGRQGGRSLEVSPPASPAPDAPYLCTMVIGFSQTSQWFRFGFETQVDDASWELFAHNGAGVSKWADPRSRMWTSARLYSPCSERADQPDRVMLTVSDDEYLPDVEAWAERIGAAVTTIRDKLPSASEIILQPVVGGPDGEACDHGGVTVRATFNQPYIEAAIQEVAGGDVVAGAVPEVRTCEDYRDSIGHFEPEAKAPIAVQIGRYYRGA